jgi:hypothetical protein
MPPFLQEEDMAKKITEEVPDAVEPAEAQATDGNAVVEGNDAPEVPQRGEPGKTPDTEDLVNLDGAKSLSPNVVVSGTKPDGKGGQELLDVIDPAVANASLQPPKKHKPAENPSTPPEDAERVPGEGEVWFETTADNQPFWSGNGGIGGPLQKGQKVVMTKEEAELLTQTKAGHVV